MTLTFPNVDLFFLIMLRFAGLIHQAPIFRSKVIPINMKVGIVFFMSLVFWAIIPVKEGVIPQTIMGFAFLGVMEFLIGFAIGFMANLLFAVVEAGGNIMGSQMAMSVSMMMDPSSGTQNNIMSRLFRWVVLVLFLTINGHHMVLSALQNSFYLMPVGGMWNWPVAMQYLLKSTSIIFYLGAQLAAPVALTIFVSDFCFGLISKVAPQIRVFQMSFQIKPTLGAFVFFLIGVLFVESVVKILSRLVSEIALLMSLFVQ
ncbi:flagellar biosynthetic protein FliR [Candidatus Margulisiibacteriota bacterium]